MIANALFYFADAKLVQLGSVVCEVMFLAIGVYPLMGWCDAMRNWIDLLLNMKLGEILRQRLYCKKFWVVYTTTKGSLTTILPVMHY
ncbi:hypothetical protein AF72_10065 [Xylella taiwanensis]|uniref:Uncharacterized protein n=1 Tax=Xylella taiwanensis TaxID=1444770 RepID=Z9JI09_9GAMM|nr:hypothetical protein AB672_07970 [Xylella taiwanensis]EWS77628.1 hypothetical protein AF72_10065 [Xylella taiwanensis]